MYRTTEVYKFVPNYQEPDHYSHPATSSIHGNIPSRRLYQQRGKTSSTASLQIAGVCRVREGLRDAPEVRMPIRWLRGSLNWTLRLSGYLKISRRSPHRGSSPNPPPRRRRLLKIITPVAIIAIGVPGAVDLSGDWRSREFLAPYLPFETERSLATELGQQAEARLVGDSRIILNTDTTATVHLSVYRQHVDLDLGEILVDASKRLTITVGPTTIVARHARFTVCRAPNGDYSVHVYSGTVLFHADAPRMGAGTYGESLVAVRLVAGRSAVIRPTKILLSSFDPEKALKLLAWVDGWLEFNGDSLADVASEFNRYNRQKIAIGDESIAHLRIGGRFRATNPQWFVQQLKMFNIRAQTVRSGGKGASVIVLTRVKGSSEAKKPKKLREHAPPQPPTESEPRPRRPALQDA